MQTRKNNCEYMYCLYTGKRKISVENLTFYLLKRVQNINNSLDNFVPFGRPQSVTVIIQLMIELDVSNNYIPEQQYQDRLKYNTMCYFFFNKNCMSQITYFEKYITDSSLKMPCVGIFVKHTLCSLY